MPDGEEIYPRGTCRLKHLRQASMFENRSTQNKHAVYILRKTRFTSFLQGERVSHAKLARVKRLSHGEQTRLLFR